MLAHFHPWLAMVGVAAFAANTAIAQGYPIRPIRIVTSEPAGANDIIARLLAQGITGPLGQPVIVENRASLVAIDTVAKAAPDGYTLIVVAGNFWVGPLLEKRSYDPIRSFAPISMTNRAPNVLVVHPSLVATSVKELITLAKSRPGEFNYGSTASGSSTHLAAELFKSMAGINIVRVQYKGTAQAVNALIAGDLQLLFPSTGTSGLAGIIKSSKVRALAVTQPSTLFPALPTVAASGLPGYESGAGYAIFAPAKTPTPIIHRLNQEIVRTLNSPDVREKLLNIGLEVVASSPEQLTTAMKAEMARMAKLIKDAGIKVE